jgi:hypothetical protein
VEGVYPRGNGELDATVRPGRLLDIDAELLDGEGVADRVPVLDQDSHAVAEVCVYSALSAAMRTRSSVPTPMRST